MKLISSFFLNTLACHQSAYMTTYLMQNSHETPIETVLKAYLERGIFFLFQHFSCKIKLVPVKFLHDFSLYEYTPRPNCWLSISNGSPLGLFSS
jgi:hypothetical protein